jgi:hypothetical protein
LNDHWFNLSFEETGVAIFRLLPLIAPVILSNSEEPCLRTAASEFSGFHTTVFSSLLFCLLSVAWLQLTSFCVLFVLTQKEPKKSSQQKLADRSDSELTNAFEATLIL